MYSSFSIKIMEIVFTKQLSSKGICSVLWSLVITKQLSPKSKISSCSQTSVCHIRT